MPIKLNGTPSWSPRIRRRGPGANQIIIDWTLVKLAQGEIEPSQSANLLHLLLVPKGDKFRVVMDCIPLNKLCEKEIYDTTSPIEILQHAAKGHWFAKIDIKDAFEHIAVQKADRWKLAFSTPIGAFQYRVLPQGWINSPARWQRYAAYLFRKLWYFKLWVYMDDVIIYADSYNDAWSTIRKVRQILRTNQVKENTTKFSAPAAKIGALGCTIEHGRVIPNTDLEALRHWKQPKNEKQLQMFLGALNTLHGNIPMLSHHTQSLLRKPGPQAWTTTQSNTFQTLRRILCTVQPLAHIKPRQTMDLYTDASDYALGAVLRQSHGTIAISSRKLTEPETRYSTPDKELLAIVWALEKLSFATLHSKQIIVHTDHINHATNLRTDETKPQRARWMAKLANYPLTWRFIPGNRNPADLPSRVPAP